MSSAASNFLARLEAKGVRLSLQHGECLKYDCPPGTLTQCDLVVLAKHRKSLVRLLRAADARRANAIHETGDLFAKREDRHHA